MNTNLRLAEKEDYDEIYAVVKESFKTAYHSDGKEQDFVVKLRNTKDYISDLEFVIELENNNSNSNTCSSSISNNSGNNINNSNNSNNNSNNNGNNNINNSNNNDIGNNSFNMEYIDNKDIIAHIMYTKTYVMDDKGNKIHEAIHLAPVSVLKEYRNKHIGSNLIKKTLAIVKNKGFDVVFLAGDNKFYKQFGFKPIRFFGIKYAGKFPEDLLDNLMALELVPHSLNNISGFIFLD
ncbi:MAG: GNAT family N-acetyltransferase [Methanobrevibacter sp.]|jgi:predicted N-acetyltransferase YhbS|nr:GNAT family N-acetyltransferase [Candidatus Methanoflexus mossambicus]